jgi:biopolymer transport protein ExbD
MAHRSKAQKARAQTRVLPEEDPEFQIAPMIDILLVLLVFFMSIATDQVLQVNKEVVLPVAKVVEAKKDSEKNVSEVMVNIIWHLDNSGKIEVDGRGEMDFGALTEYINKKREAAETANVANFRVVIRADKRAKYQYVRSVMAAIGNAKVPNVIFSAIDKEMDQPGATPAPAPQ